VSSNEFCEFGLNLNDTLRDRFVCGLRNDQIQKKLLTIRELSLDKALEIAVAIPERHAARICPLRWHWLHVLSLNLHLSAKWSVPLQRKQTNLGLNLNDTLHDRFVCGLRNDQIQKTLLTIRELSLDKALEIAVAMETATKDAIELRNVRSIATKTNQFGRLLRL
jgi:hypothetical protein